jgi:hypothetical protein
MVKEFWDVEEDKGFTGVKASDGVVYKVWTGNLNFPFQKTWWYNNDNIQHVAEMLASARRDINTLLIYLLKNPQLWNQHPIAFGVYHCFDIHIPYWNDLNLQLNKKELLSKCLKTDNLFIYQEMTPNEDGIIGLNKPKKIITIKAEIENGKIIDYELGKKRLILLTIRNQNSGSMRNYKDILDLVIHEVTHTICNDVRWVPDSKGGNHREPYPTYHKLMRKWARECGIM